MTTITRLTLSFLPSVTSHTERVSAPQPPIPRVAMWTTAENELYTLFRPFDRCNPASAVRLHTGSASSWVCARILHRQTNNALYVHSLKQILGGMWVLAQPWLYTELKEWNKGREQNYKHWETMYTGQKKKKKDKWMGGKYIVMK